MFGFNSSHFGSRGQFFSGGGGGGSGGGIPAGGVPTEKCEDLMVNTTLNSPVPTILAHLHPGDELTLAIQRQGSRHILVALTAGAEVAGSITSAALFRLISCIEKGHRYRARVLEIDGGRCLVKIYWKEHQA